MQCTFLGPICCHRPSKDGGDVSSFSPSASENTQVIRVVLNLLRRKGENCQNDEIL